MSRIGWVLFLIGIVMLSSAANILGTQDIARNDGLGYSGAPSNASVNYMASTNWAGYVYCSGVSSAQSLCKTISSGTVGSFGCWTVPQVAQTIPAGSPGGEQALSIWTGIGGTDTGSLAQVGVTLVPGRGITAWWETLPSVANSVSLSVNPGDLLCGEVEIVGENYFGQQLIYFALEDQTTGQSWNNGGMLDVCGGTLFWPGCAVVQADSAEWILESPQINGHETTLPAFNEVSFQDLSVETGPGTWTNASGLPPGGKLNLLELQSTQTPTSPAYMTQVSSLTTLPGGLPGFTVSYLTQLTGVRTQTQGNRTDLIALLTSSDTVVPPNLPPSFSLTLTATLGRCGTKCSDRTVQSSGITIQSGPQSVGTLPAAPGEDQGISATACLWWVAPGASVGDSGSSLLLGCVGQGLISATHQAIAPTTYAPLIPSTLGEMLVGGLFLAESLLLGGLLFRARRWVQRRPSLPTNRRGGTSKATK